MKRSRFDFERDLSWAVVERRRSNKNDNHDNEGKKMMKAMRCDHARPS